MKNRETLLVKYLKITYQSWVNLFNKSLVLQIAVIANLLMIILITSSGEEEMFKYLNLLLICFLICNTIIWIFASAQQLVTIYIYEPKKNQKLSTLSHKQVIKKIRELKSLLTEEFQQKEFNYYYEIKWHDPYFITKFSNEELKVMKKMLNELLKENKFYMFEYQYFILKLNDLTKKYKYQEQNKEDSKVDGLKKEIITILKAHEVVKM